MTSIVTITAAIDTVVCPSDGRTEQVFTVTNISGAPLRVGAKVLTEGPAQESWFTVDGEAERDLAVQGTDQFKVAVAIPPGVAAGKYKLRLLVFAVQRPGEDFTEGPTVACQVSANGPIPPEPEPEGGFHWWIPVLVVGVLVVGGGLAWLWWPRGIEVPDLVGKTRSMAQQELRAAGLVLGTVTEQATESDPPNTVVDQDPAAGERLNEGAAVHLIVAIRSQPRPDPDAAKKAACQAYGRTAVAQQAENLRRGCGFTGGRWQSNFDIHYNWCMAGENYRTFAPREQNARKAQLAQCASDGQPGAADAAKKAACQAYARTAVAQHAENLRRRCGFTGARWQSNTQNHYNWCMAGENYRAFAPREEKARKDLLTLCAHTPR